MIPCEHYNYFIQSEFCAAAGRLEQITLQTVTSCYGRICGNKSDWITMSDVRLENKETEREEQQGNLEKGRSKLVL